MATQPRTGTKAIDRAAELLVHVVESEAPLSVGDLTTSSGLPKSTTSRLVAALERQGLIQRDGRRGSLRPGPVLLRYASRERETGGLIELAADALDRLAALSGETVNLGVATSTAVELLDQRDSRHFLGSTNWVGRTVPLHVSVVGKVFLAYGAVPFPTGPLERVGPRAITDLAALRRELVETVARGYATAVDEIEPGLWAVGAPVLGASGVVAAALTIAGPTVRLTDSLLDDLGRSLRREAAVVSSRLGYDVKGAA
ncbi:MAG: IclR family transcriptional regulator [Thermoleophilia bacterium]|nr:IclR family transcriptional regulator [Thermoleophilia bacterium]